MDAKCSFVRSPGRDATAVPSTYLRSGTTIVSPSGPSITVALAPENSASDSGRSTVAGDPSTTTSPSTSSTMRSAYWAASAETVDQFQHGLLMTYIEGSGRFVQQHGRCILSESPGQHHPLSLTPGQMIHRTLRELRGTEALQRLEGLSAIPGRFGAQIPDVGRPTQQHVFEAGHRGRTSLFRRPWRCPIESESTPLLPATVSSCRIRWARSAQRPRRPTPPGRHRPAPVTRCRRR